MKMVVVGSSPKSEPRTLFSIGPQLYPNDDLKPLVKPLTFVGRNFV